MSIAGVEIDDGVRSLARLIQWALGEDIGLPAVDDRLADFAIDRHRVDPLLHKVATEHPASISPLATEKLNLAWRANQRRAGWQSLMLARIAHAFQIGATGFLVFKGPKLAEQIYPEPALRHCGDLDLLVEADDMAQACRALCAAGFLAADPVLRLPQIAAHATHRILRDVGLLDPISGLKIELHSRPLFSPSISAKLLAVDRSFRPRSPSKAGEIPHPTLGPGLVCYLLMHGAISGWTRLKWLADIHLLTRQSNALVLSGIPDVAENCRVAPAAKAGLLLVREVFGSPMPGALDAWLAEKAGSRVVERRLRRYAAWLGTPTFDMPNPLRHRWSVLESTLLLTDGPLPMLSLLPRSAIASGLRILAAHLPARRVQASASPDTSSIRSTETTRSPSSTRNIVTPPDPRP